MWKLGFSFCVLLLLNPLVLYGAEDPFPLYPSIRNNVEFWKKVYTEHPSFKGYVHDSSNPAIIYQVVSLLPRDDSASKKKNRKLVKKIKGKWRNVLLKIAQGKPVETAERQQVQRLWPNASSLELEKAAENIRFQHCLRDRFEEGLKRSGRYLTRMRRIIREYGLPADLAYLPHVESSFNYKAYSKFGAAGIWQFMRSTGRRFMTINYSLDERRDPIVATHAAAKLLKGNYEKLGCWALALTAYNYGANGMMRAKKELGDYGRILKKYKKKKFGFASKNFYAEFLAAREVAKNYHRYFPGLIIEPPLATEEVVLEDYFSVHDVTDYLGLSMRVFQQLNPALRPPVYNGQKYIPKGYALRLPKNESITHLAVHMPERLKYSEQKRSRFYRVRRGDTAGKIAKEHKVKLRDLIESNNLDRHARIFIGQNLTIPQPLRGVKRLARLDKNKAVPVAKTKVKPSPAKKAAPQSAQTQGGNAVVKKQIITAKPIKVKMPEADNRDRAVAVLSGPQNNLFERGGSAGSPRVESAVKDTLTPKRKKVPVRQKMERGDFNVGTLDLNTAVTVVLEQSIHEGALLGNFNVEDVGWQKGQLVGSIKVQAWETLGHYADWLSVSTRKIRLLNNLAFGKKIKTSQRIKIPLVQGKETKGIFEEQRYEFHKEFEEDFFSAYQIVGVDVYSIKKGDNIWTLCHEKLDLPFWLVKKYNSTINFDELRIDQVLVIPVVERYNS